MNVFDWTDWGTADNDKFAYTSSDLFADSLLSKTDATYSHKLPNDIVRFAKTDWVIGEKVKCSYLGITDLFASLVFGYDYYIQNIAWAIWLSPWTNSCIVWKAIDSTKLKLDKKAQNVAITVWASPFTWTNTTWWPVQIKITGWTVNPIVIDWVTVATATSHINTIPKGKAVVITYSSTPTVVYSEI